MKRVSVVLILLLVPFFFFAKRNDRLVTPTTVDCYYSNRTNESLVICSFFKDASSVNNGRKIFNDINKILRNNKKFLIEKLGKQDFCTKDSSNRRLYCWKFDVEEFGSFWIFTAPERGTSIEVAFEESQKDSFIRLFQNKVREIFELSFI